MSNINNKSEPTFKSGDRVVIVNCVSKAKVSPYWEDYYTNHLGCTATVVRHQWHELSVFLVECADGRCSWWPVNLLTTVAVPLKSDGLIYIDDWVVVKDGPYMGSTGFVTYVSEMGMVTLTLDHDGPCEEDDAESEEVLTIPMKGLKKQPYRDDNLRRKR